MTGGAEEKKRSRDDDKVSQGRESGGHRRRRSSAEKVTDGTGESLRSELERIERHRGECTDIPHCCSVADAWRARGKEALPDREGSLAEFTRGIQAELTSREGSPLDFPAVDDSGDWAPSCRSPGRFGRVAPALA